MHNVLHTQNFKLKKQISAVGLAIATLAAPNIYAADNADLQQQINLLAQQVEENQKNSSGKSDTYIGGYGEMHYNNLTTTQPGVADSKKQEIDFHRFVLFVGHDFNEKMRFFSEFEIEHGIAGDGQNGEVEIEQAYVELDLKPNLQAQAGVMLVPVGILNETHEPNTFYGSERNPVEKNIIPATWWSGGVALKGQSDSGFSYNLMVSEGLNSTNGYSIRDGRQKTSKAKASNLAYTGRVKYTAIPGLELAATLRHETDLGQAAVVGSGAATLVETHAIYKTGNFGLTGLYAQWDISGTAAKTANADRQYGYYIEPSYKINENWGVFARHNEWNKTTTSANKETQTDFGVNYWPHENIVFKADYQAYSQGTKDTNGINLAVGYSF